MTEDAGDFGIDSLAEAIHGRPRSGQIRAIPAIHFIKYVRTQEFVEFVERLHLHFSRKFDWVKGRDSEATSQLLKTFAIVPSQPNGKRIVFVGHFQRIEHQP